MESHLDWDLDYELTVKEIDNRTMYGVLELAGMSGLGIDKVKWLIESGALPSCQGRVAGVDFLQWVERSGLQVRKG